MVESKYVSLKVKAFYGLVKVLFFVTICETRFLSGGRQARLSSAEPMPYYYYNNIDGHPGTYAFGYDVTDPASGNKQFRTEERYPNGTVVGSYGYVDAWGKPYKFSYVADERGYRVVQDLPRKPSRPSAIQLPHYNPSGVTTESSITWTRPSKKKNRNKPAKHDAARRMYINSLNDPDNYVNNYYSFE